MPSTASPTSDWNATARVGVGTEHAVGEPRVEAEPREPELQVTHVLAAQHRTGAEQQRSPSR
jgi:hypothetical protein